MDLYLPYIPSTSAIRVYLKTLTDALRFVVRYWRDFLLAASNANYIDNRTMWNVKLSLKRAIVTAGTILNISISWTPGKPLKARAL